MTSSTLGNPDTLAGVTHISALSSVSCAPDVLGLAVSPAAAVPVVGSAVGATNGATAMKGCTNLPAVMSVMVSAPPGSVHSAIGGMTSCSIDSDAWLSAIMWTSGTMSVIRTVATAATTVRTSSECICPGCHAPVTGGNCEVVCSVGALADCAASHTPTSAGTVVGSVGVTNIVWISMV